LVLGETRKFYVTEGGGLVTLSEDSGLSLTVGSAKSQSDLCMGLSLSLILELQPLLNIKIQVCEEYQPVPIAQVHIQPCVFLFTIVLMIATSVE
jgi:hypothetical protein